MLCSKTSPADETEHWKIPIAFSTSLFDERLLEDMKDLEPDGLRLRPLRSEDFHSGFVPHCFLIEPRRFLDVLSNLTTVGDVSEAQFLSRFHSMQATKPLAYYIVVLEEIE